MTKQPITILDEGAIDGHDPTDRASISRRDRQAWFQRNFKTDQYGVPRALQQVPCEVVHSERGGHVQHTSSGGVVVIHLPTANGASERIEIEAVIRPGQPVGLLIRGLDSMLDINLETSNAFIVKPRP